MGRHVKLSIETDDGKAAVIIRATTSEGDNAEERSYFLDPYQAVEIANTILHLAQECGVEIKMETTGISDVKRLRLIKRVEHVIRSLAGRKGPYMASQVVDTVLSEVL